MTSLLSDKENREEVSCSLQAGTQVAEESHSRILHSKLSNLNSISIMPHVGSPLQCFFFFFSPDTDTWTLGIFCLDPIQEILVSV